MIREKTMLVVLALLSVAGARRVQNDGVRELKATPELKEAEVEEKRGRGKALKSIASTLLAKDPAHGFQFLGGPLGSRLKAEFSSYFGHSDPLVSPLMTGPRASPRMDAVGAEPKVKVGDQVPDVSLDKGFPPEKVSLREMTKGKRVVLVGLPGAFTPTWSSKQVPGYLENQDKLKAKGVSDVITYCVNDGAVMTAWAADQKVGDSIISMYGDPTSALTSALGLGLDHPGPMSVLGNKRCKRFSMYIDDGVIKTINVAEAADDPAGDANPTSTLVEKMLEDIPDP